MFFRTAKECAELAAFHGFEAEAKRNKLRRKDRDSPALRITFANQNRATVILARRIASWFGPSRQSLLWITEYGIWPSSENLHLYYKLRQSYGDHREVMEAPGHMFLGHEGADLVSYLQLVLLFGWGAFLLGSSPSHLTISHDEWILLGDPSNIDAVTDDAEKLGLPYETIGNIKGVTLN